MISAELFDEYKENCPIHTPADEALGETSQCSITADGDCSYIGCPLLFWVDVHENRRTHVKQ